MIRKLLTTITATLVAFVVMTTAAPALATGETGPLSGTWAANNSAAPATGPGRGANNQSDAGLYAKGYWSSEDRVGYCAADPSPGPSRSTKPVTYPEPKPVRGSLKTQTMGTITAEQISAMAYVVNRYGVPRTTDAKARTEQMEAVDYAIALIKFGPHFKTSGEIRKQLSPSAPKGSDTLAQKYVAESKKYAGRLRSAPIKLTATADQKYSLSPLEVRTTAGASVPGLSYTAQIAGPGVWAGNQGTKLVGATGAKVDKQILATGPGKIAVSVTYHGVPDPDLMFTSHSTFQDLFVGGYTTELEAKTSVTHRVTPSLTTQVGANTALHSHEVYDTVTITGGAPSEALKVTAQLFYAGSHTPTLSSAIPADAKPVGTVHAEVQLNNEGNAKDYVLPTLSVDNTWLPGYYTWVVSAAQTELTSAIVSAYGEPSETFVLEPHTVTGVTETSMPVLSVGQSISDRVMLTSQSGWDGEVTVASQLWGPFESKPQTAAHTPAPEYLVGQDITRAGANQEFATQEFELTKPGWYAWSTHIAQGPENLDWDSNFAEPEEVTLVKWRPEVTTQTSQAIAQPGAQLFDHLTVTGMAPGTTVDVSSTLWGPLADRPQEAASVPPGTPQVGVVITTVTADDFGEAEAQTEPMTLLTDGWYVWTEEIASDDLHDSWHSRWAVTTEVTEIQSPPVPEIPTEGTAEVPPTPQEVPGKELAKTGVVGRMLPALAAGIAGFGFLALAVSHANFYRRTS